MRVIREESDIESIELTYKVWNRSKYSGYWIQIIATLVVNAFVSKLVFDAGYPTASILVFSAIGLGVYVPLIAYVERKRLKEIALFQFECNHCKKAFRADQASQIKINQYQCTECGQRLVLDGQNE